MPRTAPVWQRACGATFPPTANAVPPSAKNRAMREISSAGDGRRTTNERPPRALSFAAFYPGWSAALAGAGEGECRLRPSVVQVPLEDRDELRGLAGVPGLDGGADLGDVDANRGERGRS